MNTVQSIPPTQLQSQAQILITIENIVKEIITSSQQHAFLHSEIVSPLHQKIQELLPSLLSIYSLEFDYADHIQAFWYACRDVGLLEHYPDEIIPMEKVFELVSAISWEACNEFFKRLVHDRTYQTKQNFESIQKYIEHVIARHRRVLAVRLDVMYHTECQPLVGIEDFYRHLKILRGHLKIVGPDADVFKGLVGFAWVIEQGKDSKGYHAHALFLFDGSVRFKDWSIAKQIGELWESITQGYGTYYNVHNDKDRFKEKGKLGIGMIFRDDPSSCYNLINYVASYLADPEKEDQYLRMKPRGQNVFKRDHIRKL